MNFNRPKVTRRRRRKGATTHLYDFITLFSFCKVRLRSFFALFLRFLPPFPPPETTSGVARKIGTGDARGKDKRLFFSVSGANATVSRSLSANAPGGRPYSPENARRPFPLCRGDHPSPAFFRARSSPVACTSCPHVSPVKQRAKEGDAAAPPSKRVLFDVRILSDVRARLFTTRARPGRAAFHAPRVTPPRGR